LNRICIPFTEHYKVLSVRNTWYLLYATFHAIYLQFSATKFHVKTVAVIV